MNKRIWLPQNGTPKLLWSDWVSRPCHIKLHSGETHLWGYRKLILPDSDIILPNWVRASPIWLPLMPNWCGKGIAWLCCGVTLSRRSLKVALGLTKSLKTAEVEVLLSSSSSPSSSLLLGERRWGFLPEGIPLQLLWRSTPGRSLPLRGRAG